jgi:malate dehydrogenase (oxaloacetate-decarboxylating)(NADP+)
MKDNLINKIEAQENVAMILLQNAHYNRDTAFTEEERAKFKLEGLLPPAVESLDEQVQRVNNHLNLKPNDIERYIYLISLRDRNETLFFKVLSEDPAKFIPIVYDPTVGEACLKFSHIYREKSGMYISMKDKGNVKKVLENWPVKDIRFICVSTGGRILGLGDLGANGMGIPLGKMQLYTACAAIPPDVLLPLLLDCGTDNRQLLADPLYIGIRQQRPSVQELDEFVDEFVKAVQDVFPECCIHFEDWKGTDAIRLLAKYKNEICCYNDDIQGTGAVTVAGLLGALNITGGKLKDQKILFFGAGSAGLGIADMISSGMQLDGLSADEANKHISLFDINGLLEDSRTDLSNEQKIYAGKNLPSRDLLQTINEIKPSILIGVSTIGGAFTKDVVEAMSQINERPVIFALSNPTEHAECTAHQAYEWSNGKAVYAAGVPFEPVVLGGKTYVPGQANNFYCFPGVSLGIYATKPKKVTDELWIESAKALAGLLSDEERAKGMVFPPQSDILSISTQVAIQVAEVAFKTGLAQVPRPSNVEKWIKSMQYTPEYPPLP